MGCVYEFNVNPLFYCGLFHYSCNIVLKWTALYRKLSCLYGFLIIICLKPLQYIGRSATSRLLNLLAPDFQMSCNDLIYGNLIVNSSCCWHEWSIASVSSAAWFLNWHVRFLIGYVAMAAIMATKLVPFPVVTSLNLIWRPDTLR